MDDVTAASAALGAGKLVAMPTETVYGLAADACNDAAVASVYAAKGRPQFNPLIVHVLDRTMAERFAVFDPLSAHLADAFWPGPLTLVLPRRSDCPLSLLVSAGLDTLAVRAPAHPVARALLTAFGGPVAAPSANRSGHVSPTRLADALDEIGGSIAVGLDGGPCQTGLESTIAAVRDGRVDILRPGPVTNEEIARVAGVPVRAVAAQGPVEAPGQLASHYAPRAAVRLNATAPEAGEAFLAFGPSPGVTGLSLNLSPSGDLQEAAANLFASLRRLDASGASTIAVMPIPEKGLGVAINDRLRRAAAPRPGSAS